MMYYRNIRGWWRILTLALTLGAAVAEVVADSRRRRRHAETREQIDTWENEGGAAPPSAARAEASD